jgi:hypothetical protein
METYRTKKNLKLVATLEQMVKNQQAKQAKEIANKQRTIAKPKQRRRKKKEKKRNIQEIKEVQGGGIASLVSR